MKRLGKRALISAVAKRERARMGYGDWRLPNLKAITLLMAFFALR